MNDKELLEILKISRRWHMLNSMSILILSLCILGLRLENAGTSGGQAWLQIGWPQRHFEVIASVPHAVVAWHYWKGDEGASFGTEYADGSIIAYGYWPNCNWNSTPRSTVPVPYCGWKQADVPEPY